MLTSKPRPTSQVFNEVNDESTAAAPSESDIEEYAKRIGIDLKNEPHLRYLAEEGLLAPLPVGWKPCKDLTKNAYYYYNTKTKTSQWSHPLDDEYKLKVTKVRQDLAMNKIQEVGNLGKPPSKQLPPLKKLGGGSKPPPSQVGGGGPLPLNKLGALKGSGISGNSSIGDGSFSRENGSNSSLTGAATGSNKQNGIFRVGGGDRPKNDHDDDQSLTIDTSLKNPSDRMVKKPLGGLTLTGEGSKFLKGDNSSNDLLKKNLQGGGPAPLVKSILPSPLNPTQRSGLISTGSSFGRKSEELETTRPDGLLSVLTEEEMKVMEVLQKDSTVSKPSVKFQLEDNVEIAFTKPAEEEETSEAETSESSGDSDSSGSENSEESPVKSRTIVKKHSATEPKLASLSNLQNRSEVAADAVKESLRENMESKLKEFQQQLDNERKKREEQLKTQMDAAVAKLKAEKDEELKRIRLQSDKEKSNQLDKIKREMEANVAGEMKKIQQQFDKEVETKKAQIETKHKKTLEELGQLAKGKEADNTETALTEQSSAEVAKMQAALKEQKETMKEDHKKQVQQMKDYYASYLKTQEAGFKSEENRLLAEHKSKISALTSSFEKETSELKSKHAASMKQMIAKLEQEKKAKLLELQKGISELAKKAEQQIQAKPEEIKPNIVTEDIQTQTDPIKVLEVIVPNKPPATNQALSNDPGVPNDEMKDLNTKYYQLDRKYRYLKRELKKLTPKASVETSVRKVIDPVGPNMNRPVVPASKSEPCDLSKHTIQSNNNDEIPSFNERHLSREIEETFLSSDNGVVSDSYSESTLYPSSHAVHSEQHIYPTQAKVNREEPPPPANSNDDKLASALKSLELLKVQILAMKEEAKKSESQRLPKHDSSSNHGDRKLYSHHSTSSLSRKKTSAGYAGQPILSNKKGGEFSRPVGGIRGARSTSELPGLVEDSHEELSHEIVKDAKEFIRTQKERLTTSPDGSPVRSAWSTPNTIRRRPQNYSLDEISYPPTTIINRIPNYSSLKRSPKVKNSHDLYSETESSGIGSLKDLESQEKKQISQDIETICSSLSNLDHQMKLMWSVVQGGASQVGGGGMVVENNKSNLNALLSSQRNKSSLVYPSVSTSIPRTPSFDISGLSPSNRALLESLKAATLSSPVSRVPSSKSTNLLMTTLDQQINEFNAAKDKILHQYESKDNNTLSGSSAESVANIEAKTKDLREWLEKF